MKYFYTLILVSMLLFSCKKSAPETKPVVVSDCDSVNVSYSKTVVPILAANCYICHKGTPPSVGALDFSNYNDLVIISKDTADYLVAALTGKAGYLKMPPVQQHPLTECEIGKIRQWVRAGSLNN